MATPRSSQSKTLWKVLAPILALIIIVSGGLYLIKQMGPQSQNSGPQTEIGVGAVLPDFELTTQDNKTIHVSDIKAKIYLINFWATWCEACMEEMPSIVDLWNGFKSKGLEIISINLDENPQTMIPRATKQFGIGFPVYKDVDGKASELLDVHAIPLTVIMNSERKILFMKDGGYDWNSADNRAQIQRWLAE